MAKLSHIDKKGQAVMVDVSKKEPMMREARAEGFIQLQKATLDLIRRDETKKGNVLTTAEIAGIQAAKKTSELIPLCHPLAITHISVDTCLGDNGVKVTATARCQGSTGIEMEALTTTAIALLTIYDMCKAVDKTMVIGDIRLIEKSKKSLHP
ncbi:MAG: cyclic pyranopterin monophosphate synthase MoaC [Bacteroidetes bacterium]|nr:cyclic pyranopterin monophosphate synthase MoaC [Bacteroidota bacterium]